MHTSVPKTPELRCFVCHQVFDFKAQEAALVLRHVAYGYDFVHDNACLAEAGERLFPEPGYDCGAFARDPQRRRVLAVAPAEGGMAVIARTPEPLAAGRRVRSEPLLCWALVEHVDGSTSMEGLVRDEEWLEDGWWSRVSGGDARAANARRLRVHNKRFEMPGLARCVASGGDVKLMARISTLIPEHARSLRSLLLALVKRQYGLVPGIVQIALADFRLAFGMQWLYAYLHERRRSPLTRLQREMVATVVNRVIGGAAASASRAAYASIP